MRCGHNYGAHTEDKTDRRGMEQTYIYRDTENGTENKD